MGAYFRCQASDNLVQKEDGTEDVKWISVDDFIMEGGKIVGTFQALRKFIDNNPFFKISINVIMAALVVYIGYLGGQYVGGFIF